MRGGSRSSRSAGRDAVAACVMPDVHRVLGRPKSRYPGASSWRQRGIAEPLLFGAKRRRVTPRCGDDPRAGHQGSSRSEPLTPLRAERRTNVRRPWRLRSCASFICARGCGRTMRPAFRAPSCARLGFTPFAQSKRAMDEMRLRRPRASKNRGNDAHVEEGAGFPWRERGKPRARGLKQHG